MQKIVLLYWQTKKATVIHSSLCILLVKLAIWTVLLFIVPNAYLIVTINLILKSQGFYLHQHAGKLTYYSG